VNVLGGYLGKLAKYSTLDDDKSMQVKAAHEFALGHFVELMMDAERVFGCAVVVDVDVDVE
jgi:hypothetical protein